MLLLKWVSGYRLSGRVATWQGWRCTRGIPRPRRRPWRPRSPRPCPGAGARGPGGPRPARGRAMGEGDHRGLVVRSVDGRIETGPVELVDEGLEAETRPWRRAPRRVDLARPTSAASSAVAPVTSARREQPGQQRDAGGSRPSEGSVAEGVGGSAAGRPRSDLGRDLQEPDVAHALEVRRTVLGCDPRSRRCPPWPAAWATRPARGRWRNGCCPPSAFSRSRRGSRCRRPQDEITRPPPVNAPVLTERRTRGERVPPPTVEEVIRLLRGVIDPELGGNIVDLGVTRDA